MTVSSGGGKRKGMGLSFGGPWPNGGWGGLLWGVGRIIFGGAAGVAHGAITVNGKLWDVAAPAAILAEAGAVLTSLRGEPIFPFDVTNYKGAKVPFLAAGPGAHPELLREIKSHS